jgi:lipopolysaccharide biosynthesis regulator YciM
VERAIRIHQNLIARPALDEEQRANALLELGMDYMRAGLYDRAENLFLELKEMNQHVRKALQNLIIIYQQERDWQACLEVSEALQPLVNESLGLARSHYYCELAEEALRKQNSGEAATLLEQAVSAESGCVRPTHLQARMAMEGGDCRKAVELLHAAVEKDRNYLPELIGDLHSCHVRLDDLAGLRRYLEGFLHDSADVAVVLSLTDLILEMEGKAAASAFISEQMERHPTIRGLLRLIELNASLPDVKAGQILVGLKDHMERLLAERPAYQCTRCGYSANTMHWQCPSCRSWSTLRRKNEPEERRR